MVDFILALCPNVSIQFIRSGGTMKGCSLPHIGGNWGMGNPDPAESIKLSTREKYCTKICRASVQSMKVVAGLLMHPD